MGEGANRSGEREPPSCPSASTCPSSPETLVMRPGARKKAALGRRNLPSLLTGFHCLSQPLLALCSFSRLGVCKSSRCQRSWEGTTKPSCGLSCPRQAGGYGSIINQAFIEWHLFSLEQPCGVGGPRPSQLIQPLLSGAPRSMCSVTRKQPAGFTVCSNPIPWSEYYTAVQKDAKVLQAQRGTSHCTQSNVEKMQI